MGSHDLTEFIVEQLQAKGVEVSMRASTGKDLAAFCFAGHDSKTPSLFLRRLDGAFYCHGCGKRGRNWNDLRAYIDVDLIREQDLPDEALVLQEKLSRQWREAFVNVELPWDVEKWEGSWRGIREDTLKRVYAFNWFDPMSRCPRILFPVTIRGQVKGWVARRLDKAPPGQKLNKPYRNARHMSSKQMVFPYDPVVKMRRKTLVLVEGPFDALRLINYNIPAISILGTGNFHPSNLGYFINTCGGKIIIAMDNDPAGQKARYEITPHLQEMFDVEHFMCPEKDDPGGMPKAYLDELWRITR